MSGQPEWSNLTTRLSSYYRSLTWRFLGRRPCRDALPGRQARECQRTVESASSTDPVRTDYTEVERAMHGAG